MRRRHLLGEAAAAAAWSSLPCTRLAAANPPRIGILDPGLSRQFEALFAGMHDLGYIGGQNVAYIQRSAAGRAELIPPLAAELVEAKVDVIVTAGPLPVREAMKATSTIPIVFAAHGDPLGAGAEQPGPPRPQRHGPVVPEYGSRRQAPRTAP
jgi:ABC-type uncharacterized transport system substrate-binding protein